jgi:GTP pyrophosphokinase
MDQKLYKKALDFATLAHHGQLRRSGEQFVNHPIIVAETLMSWGLDDEAVVAGLLHDTIEDGGATRADIVKEFGENVANIVDGVTKITNIHLKGSVEEQFVENLRKMILVAASDLRVVLVKLADRLHNMQTLQYLPSDSQRENAIETLEIYAPLAERMGMSKVKGELEDLAFKYAYPKEYELLQKEVGKAYERTNKYMLQFKTELEKIVPGKVNIRRKHLYSLWCKLKRPENEGNLEKIYDLVAGRIITETIADCYLALGAISGRWHPVPYFGVRDFIANPKSNGYRSIHLNVFGPGGKIVELQIRTQEMHDQAEMGVAAHWQYAQIKSKRVSDERLEKGGAVVPTKLNWVKQLTAWQKEIVDSKEYLDAVKFEALGHRNMVFSPIGDVYDLPKGATPIDFAYAVHTDLGTQAVGAKVNGKMVALDHKLINGDVIEVLLDRNRKKPNPDWLKFVVTTAAKREIIKISKD